MNHFRINILLLTKCIGQQYYPELSVAGGGVYAENSNYLVITNSNFENLHNAAGGGAICVYQDTVLDSGKCVHIIMRNKNIILTFIWSSFIL